MANANVGDIQISQASVSIYDGTEWVRAHSHEQVQAIAGWKILGNHFWDERL